MKSTYRWLAAGTAAALVTGSASAMELNEKLDLWGYFDMSYEYQDLDEGSSESFSVASYYLSLQYDYGDGVSARADVSGGSDEDFDLTQANVSYDADSGVGVTAGKWLSSTGWESFYAPFLYQYSYSSTLVYPAMMNGVNLRYATDTFRLLGAVMSSAWDSTDTDTSDPAFEVSAKVFPLENLTLFAGFVWEEFAAETVTPPEGDGEIAVTPGREQSLVNLWASYQLGALLLAGEYNIVGDYGGVDQDGYGWLAMANYAFSDPFSMTLRASGLDIDAAAGGKAADTTSATLAGLYSFTESLSGVLEFKAVEDKVGGDYNQVAVEAILTF